MRLRFLISVLAPAVAIIFGTASRAYAENSCAYEESRPLSFPTETDAGSATVRIVGSHCRSATLVVSVASEKGYGLFAHAAPLHHLTAARTDEIGAGDVKHVVARVWGLLGPHPLSDLPRWVDLSKSFDDEVLSAVDEETYESARASGESYICVTSYYEGGKCYWLNASGYVRQLKWLSDAY